MVTRNRSIRVARRGAFVATTLGLVMAMATTVFAAVALTTVSTDPYTNSSSYHQTELEPDTFSFGSTIVGTFQVGRFYDGGASNIGWATSTDSGATWSHGFLPSTTVYSTPAGPWARISDPSVAYDPKHAVWMISGLAINASTTGKAVLISRSTDGGLTWQAPVTVAMAGGFGFFDKEWVACDTTSTSPHYGNCYVEWDDANNGNLLHLSRSTDGGSSWSASIATAASVIGGQPLAQPNGTVVVPIDNSFSTKVESFVSTDGGLTYTGPHAIATITSHTVAGGAMRTSPLPSAEVDAAGKIYVVWHDCRFRTSCSANDIVMSTSTDGVTWSSVVRTPVVATSGSADLFIPGIGVARSTSGSTAHLGVTMYALANASCSTSTCKLYSVFVSSTNGGSTWSTPKVLFGPLSFGWLPLTNQGYMVGDYISTSYAGGKAHPVIADATSGTCSTSTVGSCHEFMVTPTSGLATPGGTVPVRRERPVTSRSDHAARGFVTAF